MMKVRTHQNNNWLKDAGYTLKEEEQIYDENLKAIIDNPRWWLNAVEFLKTYRVSWARYNTKKVCPVTPFKYVKQKVYK